MAEFRPGPPGADLRQLRVALDLDAPALVVRQVEVEDVEFVRRHQVEVAQNTFLGHEVPGHVEHEAAPGKAGCVPDLRQGQPPCTAGKGCAPEGVGAEELTQRLGAPEDTGGRAALEVDAVGGDGEPVFLGVEARPEGQMEDVVLVPLLGRQREPGGRAECRAQPAGGVLGARPGLDPEAVAEFVEARGPLRLARCRNEIHE